MTQQNPKLGELRAMVRARMRLLHDQLELFNQVRGIVSLEVAQTTYPGAAVREIRQLYASFDAAHPPQQKPDK